MSLVLQTTVRFLVVAVMALVVLARAEKEGALRGMSSVEGNEMEQGFLQSLRRLSGYCYYCPRCCYSIIEEPGTGSTIIEVQPGAKIEIVGVEATSSTEAPADALLIDPSTVCIPENMMCQQQSDCCEGLTCTYSMVLGGTLCANI